MADDSTKTQEETKKSNLWILIVILALFSGLLSMIIAVNLVKLRRNKSYSKFENNDYINAIIYWIAILVPLILFEYLLGFGFTLVIFLLTAIVTWLLTKDIGKTDINLSSASIRTRLGIIILSFLALTGISMYLLYSSPALSSISGSAVKGSYTPFPILSNKGIFKGNYSYASNVDCIKDQQFEPDATYYCSETLWSNITRITLPTPLEVFYIVFPSADVAQNRFNEIVSTEASYASSHANLHAWVTQTPANTTYEYFGSNKSGLLEGFFLYKNTQVELHYNIKSNDTNSTIETYQIFITKALPSIMKDLDLSVNYTSNYNYSSLNRA